MRPSPDWGNTIRAATAGLGSIGLKLICNLGFPKKKNPSQDSNSVPLNIII